MGWTSCNVVPRLLLLLLLVENVETRDYSGVGLQHGCKTADEMRADMASADAADLQRKQKAREEEEARKKDAAEKAAKEASHKAEVDAKKAAFADSQKQKVGLLCDSGRWRVPE